MADKGKMMRPSCSVKRGIAGLILCLCLVHSPVYARDVNAITADRSALIGSAYQSDKEHFVGQACVEGNELSSGVTTSTFSFEQSLTEKQAADQLGFQAGGYARYGVVKGEASARFAKSAVSSAYSVSAVWLSDYRLPAQKLEAVKASSIGEVVKGNFERWAETCGDEFVDEITRGAKLFFSIRVDFNSREKKQSFEASFSISGPMFGANATLEQASKEFSRDAKVTVSAFQIGGDVSKLTAVLGNEIGRAGFVECGLGDLQRCSQAIQAALAYAADTQSGFPSQLAPGVQPGGVPILYRTAPYSAAGIFLDNYPFVTEVIKLARDRLSALFEQNFGYSIVVDRLISLGPGKEKLAVYTDIRKTVDSNIGAILAASKTCYESPLRCKEAVDKTDLASINEKDLELPTLPKVSVRLFTTKRGLWPRDESTVAMNERRQRIYYTQLTDLTDRENQASAVLQIEGSLLREAVLYFENVKLRTISLVKSASSFDEKFTDGGALIVLDTTRSIPGWRDIDLGKERDEIMNKGMLQADGRFYLRILDGFGRELMADLAYARWSKTVLSEGSPPRVKVTLFTKRNWWITGTNGTDLEPSTIESRRNDSAYEGPDNLDLSRNF